MTEVLRKSLRESKKARWVALVVVSLSMFGAYYFNYALSPVKPMLESILKWDSSDFGIYTSSYTWFNVFLFMLIFSGIILDKMGIRFTGLLATIMMAAGTGINYWALITDFETTSMIFGVKTQVVISAIGFGIFGIGIEATGITVSKAVVKWFKGKEMALAMGMQMSIARLGTALALGIALPVATKYSFSSPVLLAFVLMLLSVIAFLVYMFMDKKLDESEKNEEKTENSDEDQFKIKDILVIVKNRGFWYIAILCVLFYSAVFPFLFYATDLMINKYNVDPKLAGTIPALLPFGTIFLTPLFGTIYDKKGKGATIMMIGSLILILVHGVLTVPFLNSWIIATAMVLILGVGFSLVPAAMWPSVPKIIPEKQLGSAYAVIFWIQNIGLWAIPLLLGLILDFTNPDVAPNKAVITDAISNIDIKEYSKTINLSEEELGKVLDKSGNNAIDSIVQTTNYEPAILNENEIKNIKNEITTSTKGVLSNIKSIDDKKELKKEIEKSIVKNVYPIIEKSKMNIRYNYFYDLVLFTLLGIASLFFAFLLKMEDKKKGYGLESPNIEK